MSGFEIRRSATRGAMRTDWLDARFSFSFADHVDPQRRRFGPLLALNEDRVQPDSGFAMHPHRNLEIVMLPRRGAVDHLDSQGRQMTVRPGELQWMRAGRGIRHRQWNASDRETDHHFQLWFEPAVPDLEPVVERRSYTPPEPGTWRTLLAPPAADGTQDRDALDIGVDVRLAIGRVAPGHGHEHGHALAIPARAHGGLYLHVMAGTVELQADDGGVAPVRLAEGDAIVFFDGVPPLRLLPDSPAAAELLRFDTGPVDPRSGAPLGAGQAV